MFTGDIDNQGFDLIYEVGKESTYNLLFPPLQIGIAILSIYQKIKSGAFQNNRFSEADIHVALEGAQLIIKDEEYDRSPQLKFNSVISDLQVYFLRYDTDEQLYTLKDYAESFCRHVEETLLNNFNPTQIERICNDLRTKLQDCKNQYEIKDWIDTYFSIFKPRMKSEVDRLERQIDKSVKEIRATTQISDHSILDILKTIDDQLDLLRKQNEELRSAFSEMKTINLILEDNLSQVSENSIADSIAEVRQFFPEIKYTLNLIDKRLDRIQPKLRQFFSMLNKPSFAVKTEQFLKFLLNKSTVSGQREVKLPEGIPIFSFHQKTVNFTIFERRDDIFPTKPKERVRPIENMQEKEKGLAPAKNQLLMYNKVDDWILKILNDAKLGEVQFSSYFFNILDTELGDLELALNVSYGLIRRAERDSEIKLTVLTKKIKHPRHNISLWEMKINQQI
jgi:hypothetical protein